MTRTPWSVEYAWVLREMEQPRRNWERRRGWAWKRALWEFGQALPPVWPI